MNIYVLAVKSRQPVITNYLHMIGLPFEIADFESDTRIDHLAI